ncbi:MAG: twin-arginine translocase TatA/TatE family subunit [Planctomycetes bacterium]|nr:twin-arginine translocase TatA/TatE family subunit [Planctomycetota bacterium]MCB9918651.1 twin-arginine translocase TatA/TatE family subunit [Planctomycetota bacterium]
MSYVPLAVFFGGPWEIIIIAGIVLLFFGNRIPGMARSLGSGIVEFRKGLKGEDDEKRLEGDGTKKTETHE